MTAAGQNQQGDPVAEQARRALALARTDQTIRSAVEDAPPLDVDTLVRIRDLIPAVPTERAVGT